MSVEQKKRYMKKVISIALTGKHADHSDDELPTPSRVEPNTNANGINCLPLASNLSLVVWEWMVSKAKMIAASMSPVLGSGSSKSRFVVSFYNPSSPMTIQAGKIPGQYTCDKKNVLFCRSQHLYSCFGCSYAE